MKITQVIAWLLLLILVTLSLIKLPATEVAIPSQDKWLHLTSYFLITYWFFHAYVTQPKRIIMGMMLLGAVIELLQSQTSYRSMEGMDLLANIAGVCLAAALFLVAQIKISFLLPAKNESHR